MARGGGSIEDLWCFNAESVARAIAASRVPVISGIGHEIDFTIADFVADLRAPTPSSAAEVATPNQDDLLLDLDRVDTTMKGTLGGILQDKQGELLQAQRRLRFASPLRPLSQIREKLAMLEGRLKDRAFLRLDRLKDRLEAESKLLEAANPQQILARGYALVSDEAGTVVRYASQVRHKQRLRVRFHRDQISVRVET